MATSAPNRYGHLFSLIALLLFVGYCNYGLIVEYTLRIWLLNLIAILAFCAIVGHAKTGYWRSILIDSRFKISLSRLQMVSWTAIVIGSLLTAGLYNIRLDNLWEIPLDIDIPSELYILMGISASSMVASPAILTLRDDIPDETHIVKVNEQRDAEGMATLEANDISNVVVRNNSAKEARWLDLFRGEEFANGTTVDLAKIQMFLFTVIILFTYASAIGAMLTSGDIITHFPSIDGGLVTLIGISHSAYLANKAIPHK